MYRIHKTRIAGVRVMIYQGPQPTSHPGTPVMLCLLDGMAAMNDDNDARHGTARMDDWRTTV